MHKNIELKERRDVGGMATTYFDFLKQNFKPFLNIFISYNGIFILGFLGVSYLMVTGFVGTYTNTLSSNIIQGTNNHEVYLVLGVLSFMILFIVTAIFNYSLAAAYTIEYENTKGKLVDKKKVWKIVRQNLRKLTLFVILMMLMYFAVVIVGMIVSIIPVLGIFAYYLLVISFNSWMGLSFMSMLNENKDVTEAFGEGWNLLNKYFWKSVLTNLVISMLIGILMMVILMVPGILVGIYAFHSVETGVDIANSIVANVVWILALTVFLILYTLYQSLSQFVNGVLYYSLHEETYNVAARERIDQIGANG
ncbi:MAG TPA: hypothetical protein VKX34_09305 [Aequorivita sp.]|nr:hypothetical protein [Aequorivita sp.]